ncbi:MAG TPA: transcriptional regulator [Vicinamibacterales bacterium]|jgi:DNA-binding MarR family transcriptional regulator|nr:transcriptional regulator [Vicinamibacterales bacterium]
MSDEIDRLVHEPARFKILSHLFVVDAADFLFLMQQTGLTQGNLSSHMTKLEAAGYLRVDKSFVDKRPRTLLRLTPAGRKAFDGYLAHMRELLATVETPKTAARAGKARRTPAARLKPRTT